jgi:hypothetical protein
VTTPADGHLSVSRGAFGEAWVSTMLVAAGLHPNQPKPGLDVDSYDYLAFDPVQCEPFRIQLKTTESPRITRAGYAHSLATDTFHQLRTGSSPSFLFLLVIHRERAHWTGGFRIAAAVRATCYFANLRLIRAPAGDQDSITITLPHGAIVTQQSLRSIVEHALEVMDGDRAR